MRLFLIILLVLLALIVAGIAYVRLAPVDPERWHVDPAAVPPPGTSGHKLAPENADAAAPVWQVTPAELLVALDAVALDTPRTERLAGSPESGRITYVTRSRLFGFPDFTTVEAREAPDGGSTLVMLARQGIGQSDMGVNRARIEDWIVRLDARLDRTPGT